jgi:hypothetical protein
MREVIAMTTTERKVLDYLKSKATGERLRIMVLDLFMSRSDLLRILYNLELYGYVDHINVPGDRANMDFGYIKYVWTGKVR